MHQLGVDKAKPQAIAQLMQADLTLAGPGMPTRQNIKSHLQKYRLLLAKRKEQDDRRHPSTGFHEMPSHANRAANRARESERRGNGNGRGQRGQQLTARQQSAYGRHHQNDVDVFSGAMGEEDADDSAAFTSALGIGIDLSDITGPPGPGGGFDFGGMGSIQPGAGGFQGMLNGHPMQNFSGMAGGQGVHGVFGRGVGGTGGLGAYGGTSFQISQGGVASNANKRPRVEPLSSQTGGQLTQGVLMGGVPVGGGGGAGSDDGISQAGFR